MADVLLELDLPKTRLFIAACVDLRQLHTAVQSSINLDLTRYDLQERQQSGELVELNLSRRKGSVLVVGRLRATEEPLCDKCGQVQTFTKLPDHFTACRADPFATHPLSSIYALYAAL